MDSGRYDRQERVIGRAAMKNLSETKVLVVGLGGLGVETVKNLLLMGIKYITIWEDKDTTFLDLSSQFFLTIDDIGKNRAEASFKKLSQLNEYCDLSIKKGSLSELEHLCTQFSVVVFTDTFSSNLTTINQICRSSGVKFISAISRGIFGQIFVDFGDEFNVLDRDGEQPSTGIIVDLSIDKSNNTITVDTKDPDNLSAHGLNDGDEISIKNVQGLPDAQVCIKRVDPYKFSFFDPECVSYNNLGGGYWSQIKKPILLKFKSLEECIRHPKTDLLYDYSKMSHPGQLHLLSLSLSQFERENKQLPRSYHEGDASAVLLIANTINNEYRYVDQIDEDLFTLISMSCSGEINAMSTLLGGLVAQEVQKAVTQKFSPICQWFNFESVSSLPSSIPSHVSIEEPSRSSSSVLVFGEELQNLVQNQRIFLVGAGALGCEFLKNFAVSGVGTGAKGKVTVTDMDHIELSNLSRQFLFRQEHVGQPKSLIAAAACASMNNDMDISYMVDRVGRETESTFNDTFWSSLSLVVNALDNVDARLYIDSQCIRYMKPLLESGTLGTKANSQVIIPNQTESYGSKRDPEQKQFPECTIHSFPNVIQHTISWAKSVFNSLFESGVNQVNSFLKNPDAYMKGENGTNESSLLTLKDYLIIERPNNFDDCIKWSRCKFQSLFQDAIKDITTMNPKDSTTSSGALFWSGNKRFPTPLEYNKDDEQTFVFINSSARLLANVYSIQVPSDISRDYIHSLCSNTSLPVYVAPVIKKQEENSEPDAQQVAEQQNEHQNKINGLRQDVTGVISGTTPNMRSIEFDKDDDSNHHVDFLSSASNLRARCYNIPEIDAHETKGIAGNIIPAMITTTAMITGFVMLELYKVVGGRKMEGCRNSYVNTAVPFVTMSEPQEATKEVGGKYTIWEKINVDMGSDITIKELLSEINKRTGYSIMSITHGSDLLWLCVGFKDKQNAEASTVSDWVKNTSSLPKRSDTVKLRVLAMDTNSPSSDPFDLPPIIYKFKNFEGRKQKLAAMKKQALEKKKRNLD
ncbi:ubiquitin-activating enzyme E1 [Acrasis kona]|uniref:E1 ubiquitin-activating enzyme n=1 Tax=Acrasis kona TaxID=1008807 RepID=A0AAW2ZDS1_9EUKA